VKIWWSTLSIFRQFFAKEEICEPTFKRILDPFATFTTKIACSAHPHKIVCLKKTILRSIAEISNGNESCPKGLNGDHSHASILSFGSGFHEFPEAIRVNGNLLAAPIEQQRFQASVREKNLPLWLTRL
jgi:hypothetical protein